MLIVYFHFDGIIINGSTLHRKRTGVPNVKFSACREQASVLDNFTMASSSVSRRILEYVVREHHREPLTRRKIKYKIWSKVNGSDDTPENMNNRITNLSRSNTLLTTSSDSKFDLLPQSWHRMNANECRAHNSSLFYANDSTMHRRNIYIKCGNKIYAATVDGGTGSVGEGHKLLSFKFRRRREKARAEELKRKKHARQRQSIEKRACLHGNSFPARATNTTTKNTRKKIQNK